MRAGQSTGTKGKEGYSRHGPPGSCTPTGCPGRSGCSPCPPPSHWGPSSRRRTFWGTWTAMTTQGDTIGLGQDRHSPPPIDQTTGHYQRGSNHKHCKPFGVISCLIKFQVKIRLLSWRTFVHLSSKMLPWVIGGQLQCRRVFWKVVFLIIETDVEWCVLVPEQKKLNEADTYKIPGVMIPIS